VYLAACVQFIRIDWLFEVGRDSRELGTRVGSLQPKTVVPLVSLQWVQRKVKRKDFVGEMDFETTDVTANW
jgi:hypothetical protein